MSSDTAKLQLPDSGLVRRILSSPPFHTVDGVINFRDFGIPSFPSASGYVPRIDEKAGEVPHIRPGVLFRSGEPARLTEKGKATLKELGITTIFDLRSEVEIRKYQSSTPEIEGVRFVHVPVSDSGEYDPMALAARVSRFAKDEKNAFSSLYTGILENGGPAYETILKHLRDKPGEPILVHCTAGKDRTGIFAAIIQLLLGVPDAAIAYDYHLTTYGLAPVLPALVQRFQKESIYRDNWEGFQNMGSAKQETMFATLELIRSKYGSAEGYIKARTSLTDADIERIRRNLLFTPNSSALSSPTSSSSSSASTFSSDSLFVSQDKDVIHRNPEMPTDLSSWFSYYVLGMFKWLWRTLF
ncbi:hypothetical protein ACEPAG_5697 [Sanghuangporus baumii]